jgi:hypothetical protein
MSVLSSSQAPNPKWSFLSKNGFAAQNWGLLRETEPVLGVPLACLKTPNSQILEKSTFENEIFDILAGGLIK